MASNERLKSLGSVLRRHAHVILHGQAVEKQPAVGLCHYARVEQGDHPSVPGRADESSDTLPEGDQGIRQCQLVERVPATLADPLGPGLEHGVGRHLKWQPGDDHLAERVAGHVDTGPETVGAKEDPVAGGAQLLCEFGS